MLRKSVVLLSSLVVVLLVLTSFPYQPGAQAAPQPTPRPTSTPTTDPRATATPTPAPTKQLPIPTAGLPATAGAVSTPQITPVPADVPDRNFPETGFTVPGVFVKFWDANGGLPIFGYPISPARNEQAADGKSYLVQYFERNRFEYHPEFKGTNNEVLLGLLGAQLNTWRTFPTVDPFPNTAGKIYMEATKHSLADPFLSYWNAHGGLAIFGYPISEPMNEKSTDGKMYLVQYFQRNRFEFHPENKPPYDVLLGLLGRDYMAMVGLQTVWGPPVPGGPTIVPAIMPPATPAAGANKQFLTGPKVGDGINAQLYWQDRERLLGMVNDLDFGWVTQQVEWKTTEDPKGAYNWDELDHIVNDAANHHIKVMVSVVKAPTWATGNTGNGFPKDPKDLGDFMQAMAAHFKGRVPAYMIWNEQNLTGEAGVIDPGRYVELLKAGYLGVKAADPNAIVLSGALAPTGINDPEGKREKGAMGVMNDLTYLEQMYQYHDGEMRAYADVIGTHPYGFMNPPETKYPENPNLNPAFPYNPAKGKPDFYNLNDSFYFRRIEEQRAIMEKYGDGEKQMWVTEYGWCSDMREGGYQECLYNSPEDVGSYIVRAMQYSKKYYPWMGVMFIWNLNFSTFQPWYTGPAHYSILDGDFTPRPAYNIIKNRPR